MASVRVPRGRDSGAVTLLDGRSVGRLPRRKAAWMGPILAAAVLGGLLAVTGPRSEPVDDPGPVRIAERLFDDDELTLPAALFVERYDAAASPPLVNVPALEQEIPGLLQPRLSVWGPIPEGDAVESFSWLLVADPDTAVYVVADPTAFHKVQSYEATSEVNGAPVRTLRSGDSTTLEWDGGAFGWTVVGFAVDPATLLSIARGIETSEDSAGPSLNEILGFEVVLEHSAETSPAGPGDRGWKARYVIWGGDGSSVDLTAARGRPIPLDSLLTMVGQEHIVSVRGSEALAFGYSIDADESFYTPAARLLWAAEDIVF